MYVAIVINLIINILSLFIRATGTKNYSIRIQNGSLMLRKTEDIAYKKSKPKAFSA